MTAQDVIEHQRRRSLERRARAVARAERLLERLPEAKRILVRRGATRCWLFGSMALATQTETSDVDLAVIGLPLAEFFDAASELMTLFGVRVDLVRLESAPESLRWRVEEEGREL